MNNPSKIKSIKEIPWNKKKSNRIKNSNKHGNQNFLKFNPMKKKINNLENNFLKKIRMILKSKCNKNRKRDKARFVKNFKKLKESKPIYKMRINSLNHMHKNVLNNGKEMERIFTQSSNIFLKQWRVEKCETLIK